MFSFFAPCFLWKMGAGNSLFCAGNSEIHAWTGIHLQKIIHECYQPDLHILSTQELHLQYMAAKAKTRICKY